MRAGKGLYAFFSALRDASREIEVFSVELKHASNILSGVDAFSSEYAKSPFAANGGPKVESLLRTLRTVEGEVSSLATILKPMEPNTPQRKVIKKWRIDFNGSS